VARDKLPNSYHAIVARPVTFVGLDTIHLAVNPRYSPQTSDWLEEHPEQIMLPCALAIFLGYALLF
jgi:hypothetical protein